MSGAASEPGLTKMNFLLYFISYLPFKETPTFVCVTFECAEEQIALYLCIISKDN